LSSGQQASAETPDSLSEFNGDAAAEDANPENFSGDEDAAEASATRIELQPGDWIQLRS
jgi:hypothetical protein